MRYSRKLLLSMAVPTAMVAAAGLSVMAGAWWLAGQATRVDAAIVAQHLALGRLLIGGLTASCVGCCIGFAVWILRSAHAELGGEPAEAHTALAATVHQTADSARTTHRLADTAAAAAQRGGSAMSQVVASEVRNLAQRSAAAAREIKALIGISVEQVRSGSLLVQGAGGTMQEIVDSVQRVSRTIGEITHATGEQSQGLDTVNQAVAELDRMTQRNASLVEQGAAAAAALHEQARLLTQAVARFRLPAAAG